MISQYTLPAALALGVFLFGIQKSRALSPKLPRSFRIQNLVIALWLIYFGLLTLSSLVPLLTHPEALHPAHQLLGQLTTVARACNTVFTILGAFVGYQMLRVHRLAYQRCSLLAIATFCAATAEMALGALFLKSTGMMIPGFLAGAAVVECFLGAMCLWFYVFCNSKTTQEIAAG